MKVKMNHSSKITAAIYLAVFAFLFACNGLTLYMGDDYSYRYCFTDGRLIENVSQIIHSMRGHRYNMNGRLVAHALVQLLGMAPLWVFDALNAGMFTALLALIMKISRGISCRRNNVLLLAVFGALWLFMPVFGQVCLWQDGSINYLWSVVIGLLYIVPYIQFYQCGSVIKPGIQKFLFLCLAFGAGAYSETVSAAVIFMAAMLLVLKCQERKERFPYFYLASLVVAFLGYLSIYTAPAQWRAKASGGGFLQLWENFLLASGMYWKLLGVLLVAFAILLLWSLRVKTEKKTLVLALVFFAGSLAANYILIFASWYLDRSAIGAFIFLLTADVILMYPLLGKQNCLKFANVALVCLLLVTVPKLLIGTMDIYDTYLEFRANEELICQSREQGIMDIEIPMAVSETKYSENFGPGVFYLDVTSSRNWPNVDMARYYGIASLTAVSPQ